MHTSLSQLISTLGILSLPRSQIKHKTPPSVNLQELTKFVVAASADAKWKSAYVQAGLIDSIGKTTRLKGGTTNPRPTGEENSRFISRCRRFISFHMLPKGSQRDSCIAFSPFLFFR